MKALLEVLSNFCGLSHSRESEIVHGLEVGLRENQFFLLGAGAAIFKLKVAVDEAVFAVFRVRSVYNCCTLPIWLLLDLIV